jgi:hypothetical protein
MAILSNASLGTIRNMSVLGKAIGELAKTLDAYAANGGEFYGRKVRRLLANTGDSSSDPETIT